MKDVFTLRGKITYFSIRCTGILSWLCLVIPLIRLNSCNYLDYLHCISTKDDESASHDTEKCDTN